MAEAPTTPTPSVPPAPPVHTDQNKKPAAKAGAKYFKSSVSGLAFMDKDGQTVLERFSPYAETYQGETVRRGYLETSDPRVIKMATEDHTVEEVSKSDYDKMLKGATPLGYPGV